MAILLTSLLAAIAIGLTMLTMVETWLSAGVRTSQELSYAADAAIARVQVDLSRAGDWSSLLMGASRSAFDDGASAITLVDRTIVDLPAETLALQSETDRRCGSRSTVPDCPVWRLFAHAPVSSLISGRNVSVPTYVAAWIADDLSDGDGDPTVDANGRLLVYAQSFGISSARRSVEAVFGRVASASPRLLSWKSLR